MAQWLKALTALQKILSSIPSNHMVALNHLYWDLMPSSGLSEESDSILTYIKINKFFKTRSLCIVLTSLELLTYV